MNVELERITWDEQLALFRLLRETGDAAVRDRLILANTRFAIGQGRAFAARHTDARLDRDDFISQAVVMLIRAVDNFDPELGFLFTTFAADYVRGGLTTYLTEHGGPLYIPKSAYNDRSRYRKRRRSLEERGEPSGPDDVFASLGWGRSRAGGYLAVEQAVAAEWRGTLSPAGTDNLAAVQDRDGWDGGVAAAEEVDALLSRLPAAERGVVATVYGIGREVGTLADAGRPLGVSREWARVLRNRAIASLQAAG